MSRQPAPLGAYGLALDGVDAVASLLVAADPTWPRFGITNTIDRIERVSDRLGETAPR